MHQGPPSNTVTSLSSRTRGPRGQRWRRIRKQEYSVSVSFVTVSANVSPPNTRFARGRWLHLVSSIRKFGRGSRSFPSLRGEFNDPINGQGEIYTYPGVHIRITMTEWLSSPSPGSQVGQRLYSAGPRLQSPLPSNTVDAVQCLALQIADYIPDCASPNLRSQSLW